MVKRLGTLLAAIVVFGTLAAAQTKSATAKKPENRGYAQDNAACQKIVAECKRMGYVVGGYKQDNGLWADCFDPVVNGQTPSRQGRPMKVAVSPSEIQECRTARQQSQGR
jgi:hypothetical protein